MRRGTHTRACRGYYDGGLEVRRHPLRKIDSFLLEAIEKSSWWVEAEYAEGSADLSKAPGIWRESDRVPEYVREAISKVINSTSWGWMKFDSLSIEQANELEDIVEERLTQPQGWSIESIASDI